MEFPGPSRVSSDKLSTYNIPHNACLPAAAPAVREAEMTEGDQWTAQQLPPIHGKY